MAGDAPLLGEGTLAGRHCPGGIEEVQRKELARDVTRLSRVELGTRNPELSHPRRHLGRVIPQRGSQVVERPRACRASEIGTNVAAHPVHGMALCATLGVEDLPANQRVLRRVEQRLGSRERREQQEPGENDGATRHEGYSNTSLSTPSE